MVLWRPELWLPRNVEWHQLPAKFEDVVYPVYFAIPLVAFRILWESLVGVPLGYVLGYYGNTSLFEKVLNHLLGGFARNTRSKRVLECFWRFSYYSFAFFYGFYILWDKSWLWDVRDCWIHYPYHTIDGSVWWYYMIETAFYYSLLLTAFFDVKRSDFWQLITHHVVTIGLLSTSFVINFVRVGTLVLLSHDLADVLLEGGKLFRYDRRLKVLTNMALVAFLIGWLVTRLGYYPFVIIRSAVFEAAKLIQPDYQLWNFSQVPYAPRMIIMLLLVLFFLHVFWTLIILRVVVKTVTKGEAGDVRSESEDSEFDKPESNEKRKQVRNKKRLSKEADDETDDEVDMKQLRRRRSRRS